MEEILDSIRRIIADDEVSAADLSPPRPRPMVSNRRPASGYGPRQGAERRVASEAQPRLYGHPLEESLSDAGEGEPFRDATRLAPDGMGEAGAAARGGRYAAADHGAEPAQPMLGRPDGEAGRADDAGDQRRGGPVAREEASGAVMREGVPVDARLASQSRGAAPADAPRGDIPAQEGAPTRAAGQQGQPVAAARPVSDLPPVRAQPVGGRYGAMPAGAANPRVRERGAQEPAVSRTMPNGAERPANRAASAVPSGERRSALPRKDLLSPAVDAAVGAAFRSLGDLVLPQQERTVEDLVKEILRPMLKEWLDQNLTGIVERLVRAEIERVTGSLR
ncbi:DUF2497 domain-containing protein [Xanthobacter agilis]|uniref:DUF2497 domain-containing protein n=1 Tax=Xanthobacter agilis TaxID=47492 RepID=UPI00372C201B